LIKTEKSQLLAEKEVFDVVADVRRVKTFLSVFEHAQSSGCRMHIPSSWKFPQLNRRQRKESEKLHKMLHTSQLSDVIGW
jgi:hypothetical protein